MKRMACHSFLGMVLGLMATNLFSTFGNAQEAEAVEPLRVLIVTGGHDFERASFFKMFDSFASLGWKEVSHPEAREMFAPQHRSSYDVVVSYDMPSSISEEDKTLMQETFREGKPWVVMHHALASYPQWPEFRRMIGGRYLTAEEVIDGKVHPPSTFHHDVMMNIRIADKEHPITSPMQDYSLEDEVYGGVYVSPEVHVLLTTDHPESSKQVAWTTRYGASRVVVIQGGHGPTAFENEHFRGLVERSILWAAGRP